MSVKSFIAAILIMPVLGLMQGCKKFELSPYQEETVQPDDMTYNLNARNLEKLKAAEPGGDDTVTIIYTGDSQRFYDRLEDLVKKANTLTNVDFMVISGDIADFGVLQEYFWVQERLDKLNMPYLCAVGNHDLAANNGDVYKKIFGDKNYSFRYKKYKFLVHDTNGREYGFNGAVPDMGWLRQETHDTTASWFVGLSHVPPYDVDFDNSLELPYKNLFGSTPGFILSLHGHLHGYSEHYFYDDNVLYLTSNSVQKQEFVLIKLIHGTVIRQMIPY